MNYSSFDVVPWGNTQPEQMSRQLFRGSITLGVGNLFTATRRLMTRICSEKGIIRQFCCVNVIHCTYTNRDVISATHLAHMVQPIAPRLQACAARYCTKQHEIKPRAGEKGARQRHSKHGTYEAAARVTQHAVLQKTFYLWVKRVHSKIMIKRIV